jgi:chromosome partitioning protein
MEYSDNSTGPPDRLDATDDFHGVDGEHPWVTLKKVSSKRRPDAQVLVFANEKGGVGKSTLAFHCAIALCDAGAKVAVLDLDLRQRSVSTCIESRNRTARCLEIDLPSPNQVVLQQQNGAQLSQEIERIGAACDFVMIDLAGHDSAVARYAIGMADTLVTPINTSSIDLNLLGNFDPVSGQLKELGAFTNLINALNEARLAHGRRQADWIVAKNRVRAAEKNQQVRVENALQQLAASAGFRISQGLKERVVYRELLPFGLTHLDLKRIPGLARMQSSAQDEIAQLLSDLNLRPFDPPVAVRRSGPRARVSQDLSGAFATSLQMHAHPTLAKL